MQAGAAVSKNTGAGHRRFGGVWEGTAAKRASVDADRMSPWAQIKTLACDTKAETPRCSRCCTAL
jgi:hypothetical protein